MFRPSTFENPFAEPKQRKTDDPELIGKILGADAEAAMRKGMKPQEAPEPEPKADFELTDKDREKIIAEQQRREEEKPWTHEQLVAWAEEIGRDGAWVDATFTIHSDGTLTVADDLDLFNTSVSRLPQGLTKVGGKLDVEHTHITSLKGFPKIIGGHLNISNIALESLDGFPQHIGGDLNLSGTWIPSSGELPPPENIGGQVILELLSDNEREDIAKEEKKGYHFVFLEPLSEIDYYPSEDEEPLSY